jgi:Na+-translocating ferredoxin:NAD+ oxidoreductase subunit B
MLIDDLNAVLPQTQCQRCGFAGCLPYAQAMANGDALPNRCPPGGDPGLARLAKLLEMSPMPLEASCGDIGPRTVASIQPNACIGCTKCIDVCPTDAIVGAPKQLHLVITEACTGCDLCLPPCPVDCIDMVPFATSGADHALLSYEQWTHQDASNARARYEKKQARIALIPNEPLAPVVLPQEAIVLSAIERARLKAKQKASLSKQT